MDIIPFANIGKERWDAFCDASPEAWLRHRSEGLRAALALEARSKDHSFGITRDGTLVAIAPLVTQPLIGTDELEFAFSVNTRPSDTHSLPTPAPALVGSLSPADQETVRAECFEEIDRRAHSLRVARSRMLIDPLTFAAQGTTVISNPLIEFGYVDASTVTHIVDLCRDEGTLRSRISKGHRSDLTFAEKHDYEIDFFDADSVTEEMWDLFTGLYELAAGRPIGTSNRLKEIFERLRSGFALLSLTRRGHDEYLSGALVTVYKRSASYGMAATDPRYRRLRGIGQFQQWHIMQELKRRSFERYDMGWQSGNTPKEAAIANFKRHFGGDPLPLWIGIKNY